MYARSIVEKRLEIASRELGFMPEYHTPSEIDDFQKRLEEKYAAEYAAANSKSQGSKDPQSSFQTSLLTSLADPESPKLNSDEVRFIKNERALAMCDASYFLESYYWIKTPAAIQRFTFLPGQRVYFNVISEIETMGFPIEIICCKARQHGISTATEGLMIHRVNFGYGVNAVVASADLQKTGKMAQMTFMGYDMLPWWLAAPTSRRVESDKGMIVFGGLRSGISFQHGSQTSGIARGDTVKLYHLCLSGKTLVRAADSSLVPIKEIRAGDQVLDRDGNIVTVKNAWKSPRSSELTAEIQVWGTPTPLSTTRDHRVLEETRGWVEAKDIRQAEFLVYPVRPIHRSKTPRIEVFKKYDGVWGKERRSKRLAPEDWEPTFALGRIVGLYLAEGSLTYSQKGVPNCIYFSIHRDEIETVESWCKEVFGDTLRNTLRRKNSKTAQVCVNRRGFAYWLIENFGTKDEKRISDLCWEFGRDFAKGVVYGYLFGDGHFAVRDNGIYASSIRVAIPIGIRELIASLGWGWSQIAWRDAGFYYNRNCQAQWILTVAGETARKMRDEFGKTVHQTQEPRTDPHWRWTSGGIAIQVSHIGEGFSEDFYDIEIASENHAFVTACGVVHNSECASYTNPQEQIEASLFKCVHPYPDVYGVLESTAEGDMGWFPDTYWFSKREWENRRARLCALFLPWFLGTDKYPTATWIRNRPVPRDWKPEPETMAMKDRAELYIQTSPVLRQVLGGKWTLPREQMWYWETQFLEHRAKGIEKLWAQEMPTDDREAFVSSYDNVFGREVIAEIDSRRRGDYHVYAVIGQSIEERHEPDEDDIDDEEPVIPVAFTNRRETTYRWELVPLKWQEYFRTVDDIKSDDDSHMGKLFVWLPPQRGYDYSVGIRTGNGIGMGQTVIVVSRRARNDQEPDEQAAEFRSDTVSHVEAYAWAIAICAYYSKYMGQDGMKKRQPYVAIEQVEGSGDLCYTQMRKMGYTRFHKMTRYDSKASDMRHSQRRKVGWFSYAWATPIYTDSFVTWTINGWFKVNSPFTLYEMNRWEAHVKGESGKVKYIASEDSTDAGLLACALAAFCVNDMKSMAYRTEQRRMDAATRRKHLKLDIEPTRPGLTVSINSPYTVMNDTFPEELQRYVG